MITLTLSDDETTLLLYVIDAAAAEADDCPCDDRVCEAQERATSLERIGNKILRQRHA